MTGPSVSALRLKHARGAASLPDAPTTPAGRILGVALLADTLPGSVGEDAPREHVTASLAVRWSAPPDTPAAAAVGVRLRHLRGHAPYLAIEGRIRTAGGGLVASTFALFAPVPAMEMPDDHAGELSSDLVGAALDEGARAALSDGSPVALRPEWANRRGILHGAVGSALASIAAARALMGPAGWSHDAWPRLADAHVRFIRPVAAGELRLEVEVLRRSERSADVDVRAFAAGEPAILGRYLLAVPGRRSVR